MKQLKRLVAMALLCMVSTILYAQKIEATGTVVDQTGETVIGATIMEKGTTNGTVTDFDGNFKLTTASGAKIVVSYIGFMTQELNAEPTMKIVLKEDAQSLQEVVVTGYTTQRKADLTGSVSVVTVIPATFPCNALIGSLSEEVLRSFVCTTATEPVRSALRCVV